MVLGIANGLASHNSKNHYAIYNKMKDYYRNEKLPQIPWKKYKDEVPPELQSKQL